MSLDHNEAESLRSELMFDVLICKFMMFQCQLDIVMELTCQMILLFEILIRVATAGHWTPDYLTIQTLILISPVNGFQPLNPFRV